MKRKYKGTDFSCNEIEVVAKNAEHTAGLLLLFLFFQAVVSAFGTQGAHGSLLAFPSLSYMYYHARWRQPLGAHGLLACVR